MVKYNPPQYLPSAEKLPDGEYIRQVGEPVWMPKIG